MDDDLGSGSDVIPPNVTCSIERVALRSYEFILPTVALGLINVAVIVGNSLVILAVFTSAKLRTTTNAFVCSLAVADLLVGLMVLPFSNANEVLRFWVFGPIWCSVWLAVDVWLCTASILNLVAISFDRYVAISRPFKYHNLLSPKRGKVLVGCVWILSFVICFPPLIGWNEQGKGLGNRFLDGDQGGLDGLVPSGPNSTALSNEFGSGSGMGNSDGGEILGFDARAESLYIISSGILKVHRNLTTTQFPFRLEPRRASSTAANGINTENQDACEQQFPECGLTSDPGYIVYSALGSFWIPAIIMCVFYWKIYRTAVKSTAALKQGMLTTKGKQIRVHRGGGGAVPMNTISDKRRSGVPGSSYSKCQYRNSLGQESTSVSETGTVFINTNSTNPCNSRNKKYRDPSCGRNGKQKDVRLIVSGPQPDFPLLGKHPDDGVDYYYGPGFKQKKSRNKLSLGSQQSLEAGENNDLNGVNDHNQVAKRLAGLRKTRAKNSKLEHKLEKLNKEKKAAKTVGIIVGCFILCWLPFFTVYLLGALCPDCTPPLLFSIFFWLGYCNSAINPCVYALFSRDFRFAFKKLLRCNCRVEPRQKQYLGFVTKRHSFRMHPSSRSNDSNSD